MPVTFKTVRRGVQILVKFLSTPPFLVAEELESSGAPGTSGFRELLDQVGKSIEKEYPTIRCCACKNDFQDPVWRCQPCTMKKMKVLGEYKVTVDAVRMMLAQDARAKVRFDAEKFVTVKLRGHGLPALKALREVLADADPEAVTELQQTAGKRGGKKMKWIFKVTQAEGLHTLFSPAFRGATDGGFLSVGPAGVFAFHPPVVLSVEQGREYGAIPVMKLTVSSCCMTQAGTFRFTAPYMKVDLKQWRTQVMRSVRDGVGLVLQGTTDRQARASLLSPAMRATLRALG